jgi:hypothetical protein
LWPNHKKVVVPNAFSDWYFQGDGDALSYIFLDGSDVGVATRAFIDGTDETAYQLDWYEIKAQQ